jgi:hypothetical protein
MSDSDSDSSMMNSIPSLTSRHSSFSDDSSSQNSNPNGGVGERSDYDDDDSNNSMPTLKGNNGDSSDGSDSYSIDSDSDEDMPKLLMHHGRADSSSDDDDSDDSYGNSRYVQRSGGGDNLRSSHGGSKEPEFHMATFVQRDKIRNDRKREGNKLIVMSQIASKNDEMKNEMELAKLFCPVPNENDPYWKKVLQIRVDIANLNSKIEALMETEETHDTKEEDALRNQVIDFEIRPHKIQKTNHSASSEM